MQQDVGNKTDSVTCSRLQDLNAYVPVSVLGELDEASLSRFQVMVVSNASLSLELQLNDLSRKLGIRFLSTATRGFFGLFDLILVMPLMTLAMNSL